MARAAAAVSERVTASPEGKKRGEDKRIEEGGKKFVEPRAESPLVQQKELQISRCIYFSFLLRREKRREKKEKISVKVLSLSSNLPNHVNELLPTNIDADLGNRFIASKSSSHDSICIQLQVLTLRLFP